MIVALAEFRPCVSGGELPTDADGGVVVISHCQASNSVVSASRSAMRPSNQPCAPLLETRTAGTLTYNNVQQNRPVARWQAEIRWQGSESHQGGENDPDDPTVGRDFDIGSDSHTA